MSRDPLSRELTDLLLKFWAEDVSAVATIRESVDRLKGKLIRKYRLEGLYTPQPSISMSTMRAAGMSESEIAELLWEPVGLENPLSFDTNWGLPRRILLENCNGTPRWIFPETRPEPPAGQSPMIVFHLSLKGIVFREITVRDLARLGREFRKGLREALRGCPPRFRNHSRSEPDKARIRVQLHPQLMDFEIDVAAVTTRNLERLEVDFRRTVRSVLKRIRASASKVVGALAFLQTVSRKNFYRDLRRYDLHVQKGLSFRLIAAIEAAERRGHATSYGQSRVGNPVRGEDAVEGSVRRIYRAIHRKEYFARRRRLDAPGEGLAPFHCPTHGSECVPGCPYLEDWLPGVNASLPTDNTGCVGTRGNLPPAARS